MKSISVSKQYAPLRVCADVCFYLYVLFVLTLSLDNTAFNEYGIYGIVSDIIQPWALQIAIFTAACYALGFLIVRLDSAVLRFILSLLPGLSFVTTPFRPALLVLAAAWAYYIIYMTIGSFEVYVDVYRRKAKLMLIVVLVLTCCLIVFHFGADSWEQKGMYGGEIYGLLYFISTVLSLRGMRLSYGAPTKMRALDIAHVVALPALLIALFFLLRSAVPGLTWLIRMFMRFLRWLYLLFFPEREVPKILYIDEDALEEEDVGEPLTRPNETMPVTEPISGEDPHVRISHNLWLSILIVFLTALLVYIAIRLVKSKQTVYEKPRLTRERFEKVPPEKTERRRSSEPALTASVKQIRKTYRSYLERVRSLDIRIFPSDTSEDVLANSSAYIDVPENRTLRSIYIAARYGDPGTVTSKQADEAKRCLSVIEEALEKNPAGAGQMLS